MFNNFIEKVLLFSNSLLSERKNWIESCLKKMGIASKTHIFHSCFGEGCNVWAEIGNKQKKLIISAHYDGKSIFDNSAGVFCLIDIAKKILNTGYPFSVILLFSDLEETYQQGSAYFLKDYHFDIVKSINIDGFGIGNNLYTVHSLIRNTNTDSDLFLTDKDEFTKKNIPSTSYFTAFSEDFETATKTRQIYETFKKYQLESFFRERFDKNSYEKTCFEILNIISN